MPKVDVSKLSFNIGIPTIALLVVSCVTWLIAAERADAKRDERLNGVEKTVKSHIASAQEIHKKIHQLDTRVGRLEVKVGRIDEKTDIMLDILRDSRRR